MKQLDSLRVRKTDKIDAEKLAKSQLVHNRKPTYLQEEVYQHLRDLSRFYQNMKISYPHQLENNIGT